jgi:exportin-2 (importin alpha re-exporter)
MRVRALQEGGVLRFSPSDLQPHLAALLDKLFAGFKLPESGENEYLMRAVTRVIG